MIGKKARFVASALMLGISAGSGVLAEPPTPPAAAGSTDERLKQLEQQLQQQQEQNRQILEALKQMQQGQPPQTPAAATPASATSAAAPKKEDVKFTHGWVARIMPVGSDAKIVPADEIGHFVASKDSYRFGDFSRESGLRSGADVGWKGEAYLEVTEPGRHTFSINFIQDNPHTIAYQPSTTCIGNILVEGQSVAQGANGLGWPMGGDKIIKSVVGGADLEPGRYRIEFWTACGANGGGNIMAASGPDLASAMNVTFEMMVKRPSDAGPVSANKALVIKVQKS